MCGITALFRYTEITETDRDKLSMMNREMHYRGPDDEGTWSDDTCGLAQTRLSIIGLARGHQPLFNEDRSLVLVCNGEIYNYIELKKELEVKGHVFSSDTDSETILHLYEEYGVKCLERLRGMFAFCLWDSRKKELFAARDRIGEKTLYYSILPTGIVFSTELKAILRHFLSRMQPDIQSMACAIRYNYPVDLENTWIKQVKRLKAGEFALVDHRGPAFFTYWQRPTRSTFEGTAEEARESVLQLMKESVKLCLRSDVPVAVLLSGGIDSSAIAALAKELGREVHAITAGYRGQHDCDERPVARRFAKEQGLILHEVELDEKDFMDIFFEYTKYIDEPVCDIASMSQWALYRKAKELGFTVLLGGLGGDELFYGYPELNRMAESMRLHRYHQQLFPWRGKKGAYLKFILRNWKYVLYAGYPEKIDDRSIVPWTYADYMAFARDASFCYNGEECRFSGIDVHLSYEDHREPLGQLYDMNFATFMNTLCLYLADRLGMGNSVEIRSPLVDYKLVEFVSTLPVEMKYCVGQPKYFLKEILQNTLPGYILTGRKMGFTPPMSFVREIVSSYQYKHFRASSKFFNSILADRLMDLHIYPDGKE